MFLDSEPEGKFEPPQSGMPSINQKKNCYTVVGDGENLHVLKFFAVGNRLLAVLFYIVKGGVDSQFLTTNMTYLLFIKLCIAVALRMQHSAYFVILCVHAWHAVPSRK